MILKKINIIIQARLSSSRFPSKIFEHLWGQRIIDRVVNECLKVEKVDCVVLAIPKTEFELSNYLRERFSNKIVIVEGSMTDVRSRFIDAINLYPCEAFIRVCADNPLIQASFLSELISTYYEGDYDYIYNDSRRSKGDEFIDGFGAELIKAEAFLERSKEQFDDLVKEHVTWGFSNDQRFKLCVPSWVTNNFRSELIVDINTLEDLKVLNSIQEPNVGYSSHELLKYLHEHTG